MKKVNVITMGCSKNLVDSEVLLNQLERGKWSVVHDGEGTGYDAVVINTCGFIQDAKQESIDMILDYAGAKTRGEIGRLYVMGCLSERYHLELKAEIPEVDRFFGKFDMKALAEEMKVTFRPRLLHERVITTPSHFAYLKISEGCNRKCGFCAIPGMTGKYKSRPVEELVKEAAFLARKGVRELLVIAQDLSFYGIDLYGKNSLGQLLQSLSGITGIGWIRVHYLYPSKFPYDILPLMRDHPRICSYLDLPVQHISDPVLKRMKRNTTRTGIESMIRRIRKEVPGVALRTTLLVGYPGETEQDFAELCRFVEDTRFDRLGVFAYSHEEGTYAYRKLDDSVPGEVKKERAGRIMAIQQAISLEINESRIGKTLLCIIDRKEGEYWIGRSEFDSPEVDGEVLISAEKDLVPGQFVNVEITGAGEFDLFGKAR
jgi:ribosomal protein S12 methylthiotransferase